MKSGDSGTFWKMEKNEVRIVIKYLTLKGLSITDIKNELDSTLGDSSPSTSTIHKWHSEFKRGSMSTNDAPRSGRPKMAADEGNVEKVKEIVLSDRRLKVREIAEASGIPKSSVFRILHEDLGMKKLCARWVPRLLTDLHKENRVTTSKQCLALINSNPNFFSQLITMDETWLHHYTPETKQQSMQWTEKGGSAPKKAKAMPSAGKVMASVFWDTRGIIMIDYLEKGRTITGAHYVNQLDQLKAAIKEKRPCLSKKKIYFLQDNAPAHTSKVSMQKIKDLKFELIAHPPYSPDLAPSDFFLFPNLKKSLAGKRFSSNAEVIAFTEGFFCGLDKSAYKTGMESLEHRLMKCIDVAGEYIEK